VALLDVLATNVAVRGDQPFLLHEGRRVTYRELDRLANRAANALRGLGVAKGDRVTLAVGNSVEYVVGALGVLKAGAILHPVNAALGAGELGYVLAHAAPRVILVDAGTAPAILAPALERPPGVRVAAFGSVAGAYAFDALMGASADTRPDVRLGADDYSTLLYTSGTTGRPKGVLFTHGRTGTSGPHFIQALGLTDADTILAVTPLFHGNAWGAVVTALQCSSASWTTPAASCLPARWARSCSGHRHAWPRTSATPSRPPKRSATAGSTPATWVVSTRTAGSTSSTASVT